MKKSIKIVAYIMALTIVVSCFAFLSACDKKPDDGRRIVEEDTVYYVDILSSKVKDIPLMFLDKKSSVIILRKDGTATFRLKLSEFAGPALNDRIGNTGSGEIEGFQIILNMLYEYLPGLDLSDINKTISVIKAGLGIDLIIDPEEDALPTLLAHLGENRSLPSQITIPKEFALEINTTYYIKDVVSEYSGKTYTGIYWGNHHEDGEAFFLMDLTIDEEKEKIIINYELMDIYIVAFAK